MLAALTPPFVSVPVTVAMHGVAFGMHTLVSRSLSTAPSEPGSILYFRLAGVPISNSHAVAPRQNTRPGTTLVVAGGVCAPAKERPNDTINRVATTLVRANKRSEE